MENEFHIKEERVKAQQSSAKTHDKDSSHNDSATKDDKSSSTSSTKAKAKSEGEGATSTTATKETAKAPSVTPKPKASSHDVVVKKEGSVGLEHATKKNNGEKIKDKSMGKDVVRKTGTAKEDVSTPCWDIAPTHPASQPASGTTTPLSTLSGEKPGRHGSPSVHNGPAATTVATTTPTGGSPKPAVRRSQADSPDTSAERGKDL